MTTGPTSNVSATGATLSASFEGATGTIYDRGFQYRKSGDSVWTTVGLSSTTGTSGSFSMDIEGLGESTTYEYQAYVNEWNATTGQYEDRFGAVASFTTLGASVTVNPGYLSCYEVPAINHLSGSSTTGTVSARDDKWYRYYTTNSKQQIATHTYTLNNKRVRNYSVLYDGSKYAPLWSAFAMHASMWPDNGALRDDDWTSDPAISMTQQTGLDNALTVGYSRGHFVASQYRKSSDGQNLQTFYYSNQAPQWQNGFNSGVWSTLEQKVVANAPSGRDTLYVVVGVLYEGTTKTLPSGNLNVPIPSHFYTCLMKCSFNTSGTMTAASGIAYLYTNESHTGSSYNSSNYVTTIDAIEQRTGFDFFHSVPGNLQTTAESSATPLWSN